MISKTIAILLCLGSQLVGAFADEAAAGAPFSLLPNDSLMSEAEPQSPLRGRQLQGDQDVGDPCGVCASHPKCKAGLECDRPSGVCTCGFTCTVNGVCKVAPPPEPADPAWCFSASATVQTLDRGIVAMKDLLVGDKVLTNAAAQTTRYEPVYAFGHWDPTAKATFLQIHHHKSYNDNALPLEVTADHLLQVNGKFEKASSVQVGDTLQDAEGVSTKVVKIQSVTRKDGVYAPLTPSGTLIVDTVLASSYVSLQKGGNEYPKLANGVTLPILTQQMGIHMALSPYRMLCMGVALGGLCHSKTEDGISTLLETGIQLAKYADTLSLGMQLALLVVALAFVGPFYLVETLFGARYGPMVVCGIIILARKWWRQQQQQHHKQKIA